MAAVHRDERVGEQALADRTWQADVTALPAVSYRWSPGLLAAELFGGSVLLAALGVLLAWKLTRPGPTRSTTTPWRRRSSR